jgi:phage/plasmid-like protein (TIGR03299 family)
MTFEDQKVLYRSDTKAPLSVVSGRYQVVQPKEVLEFYRDLTEVSGYELETAGVSQGRAQVLGTGTHWQVFGPEGHDVVNGYLLLATSCDGTLATTATPTTIRVVCNNTLSIALSLVPQRHQGTPQHQLRCPGGQEAVGHCRLQWDSFMYRMKTLSERKVKSHESMNYFLKVLCQTDGHADPALG